MSKKSWWIWSIALLVPGLLWSQCDDDTRPPRGSIRVTSRGCSPTLYRLFFDLSANESTTVTPPRDTTISVPPRDTTGTGDDDDDDDDLMNGGSSSGGTRPPADTTGTGGDDDDDNNGMSNGNSGTTPPADTTGTGTPGPTDPGDDDDDDDDDDGDDDGDAHAALLKRKQRKFNVVYSLNGQTFQLNGIDSAYTMEVPITGNQALVFLTLTYEGCTATINQRISLAPPNPPVIQVTPKNPTCGSADGVLEVVASGGTPPYRYSLNGGGPVNTRLFSNLAAGSYTLRVQDNNGCESSVPAALVATSSNLAPAAIAPSVPSEACLLEDVSLEGTLPAGSSGVWTVSSPLGILTNPQRAQASFRPLQAGRVELVWTLSAGTCPNYSQAKVSINIAARPQVKNLGPFEVSNDPFSISLNTGSAPLEMEVLRQGAKGNASIGADGKLLYTARRAEQGADTVWFTACDPICSNACDTGWVALKLSSEEAICELEKIDPRAIFPEGITPNGDGYNDALIFRIVDKLGCPSNYAQSDITIFNRWGDKVFVQEPYENQWTGTTREGQVLPPGVYYYVLRIRPQGRKEFVKFGSVSIFK